MYEVQYFARPGKRDWAWVTLTSHIFLEPVVRIGGTTFRFLTVDTVKAESFESSSGFDITAVCTISASKSLPQSAQTPRGGLWLCQRWMQVVVSRSMPQWRGAHPHFHLQVQWVSSASLKMTVLVLLLRHGVDSRRVWVNKRRSAL